MESGERDYEIERLEADLRESRFKKWDVETFLVERHQKKIEALTRPQGKWAARWEAIKQIFFFAYASIIAGILTITFGYWLLTGESLSQKLNSECEPAVLSPAVPRNAEEREEMQKTLDGISTIAGCPPIILPPPVPPALIER